MSTIPSIQQDETTDNVQRNFANNASKVVSQVLAIVKRNPLNQFSTRFSLGLEGDCLGGTLGIPRVSDSLYLPPGAEKLATPKKRRRLKWKRTTPGVKKTTATKR